MYKSFTGQTLHYFARPHAARLRVPVTGPAAWKGAEIASRSDFRFELEADHTRELEQALARATATGKPLSRLRASDFPLPSLAPHVVRWRRELTDGRGFLLIRGVPVKRWGREATELVFWCFGLHLGEPGAQNRAGDLLGHVIDTGESASARTVRRYRTSANIAYHCDAADVVGLLCLHRAPSGGQSRIVSSASVYNALLEQRPDLIDRLYEPFLLDAHAEGGLDYFPITPCCYAGGRLRTFWHSDYFRSVTGYPEVGPLSARDRELLETYEAIAASPELYLDMDLEPGDIQLLSNHSILHARTEYRDAPDPEQKRHLLRLWLSLSGAHSLEERTLTMRARLELVTTLLRFRARRLLRGGSAWRKAQRAGRHAR